MTMRVSKVVFDNIQCIVTRGRYSTTFSYHDNEDFLVFFHSIPNEKFDWSDHRFMARYVYRNRNEIFL